MKSENGATAIEYAMIASLIAAAIVVAVTNYTGTVGLMYNKIETAISEP